MNKIQNHFLQLVIQQLSEKFQASVSQINRSKSSGPSGESILGMRVMRAIDIFQRQLPFIKVLNETQKILPNYGPTTFNEHSIEAIGAWCPIRWHLLQNLPNFSIREGLGQLFQATDGLDEGCQVIAH